MEVDKLVDFIKFDLFSPKKFFGCKVKNKKLSCSVDADIMESDLSTAMGKIGDNFSDLKPARKGKIQKIEIKFV